MTTSLLFTASDRTRAQEPMKPHLGSEETKTELPTKSINRGRKPSKYPQQKKQPQRGLGVAQLERLRLQEIKFLKHSGQFQIQTPLPINEPLGGVPVQYGAVKYSGGPVVINGTGGALFGVEKAGLMLQSSGNRGYCCDVGGLKMDHLVMVDPSFYGFGISDERLNETSKELSSIPNPIPCLSSARCDTSCKEVEVVAVHRKGNTGGGGGGRVVMEYEFFPVAGKNERSAYPDDMETLLSPSEASCNNNNNNIVAAAASTTTFGTDTINFVDLSLKLSF